jgi:ABC-type phosphate transport system substrate-binding protein
MPTEGRNQPNVKRDFARRCALVVVVLGAAAGSLLTAIPASATLPAGQVAVALGGSDTTDSVMNQIAANAQFDNVTINGAVTRTYNIPAFSNTPKVVQGDADCTDVTWTKDPLAPGANTAPTKGNAPFGSSAGRNYLREEGDGIGPGSASGDAGCIDVARSSGGPRAINATNDLATFEYYAFALDAVSWATTSNKAPGTMTTAQLAAIYDCTTTDWGQLPGGTPGAIQRYIPQVGSGTRSFFLQEVLGKSSSYTPPTGVAGCPDSVLVEENNGTLVADADLDKAILPYSTALWDFQETNRLNPTIDLRRDARLGGITTAIGANGVATAAATSNAWSASGVQYKLDTAGVVNESNVKLVTPSPAYPGIRYVFDSGSNRPGYVAGRALFGFVNAAGAGNDGTKLCNGQGTATAARVFARNSILSAGLAPLNNTGPDPTKNVPGSTCRKYVP